MHDQRVVGRAALDLEDPRDGGHGSGRRRPARTRSRSASPPGRPAGGGRGERDVGGDQGRHPASGQAGSASRNSSVASMKSNDSGVAKWSVRRRVTSRASGSASTRPSAGRTKSWSPTTTRTGTSIAARSAGRSSVSVRPLHDRRQRDRIVARLVGVLREQAGPVVVGVTAALDRRRRCGPSPRRRVRTRCGRYRPARAAGIWTGGRWPPGAASSAPSENPTASTGPSGSASMTRPVRSA